MGRRGLVLVLLLVASSATAGPDSAAFQAIIDDDGAVIGTVTVASPPDAARAKVTDPAWVASVGDDSTSVKVSAQDGGCSILDYVSEHPIATATYRVRQCPTATGVSATLVESDSFSTYEQSWSVTPDGTGSALRYRLNVVSTLPVPKWIVRKATRGSVERLMQRVGETL